MRELLGAGGKLVRSFKARASLKPSQTYTGKAVEAITVKLKPGTYTESIKIVDPKTKKVLGSGTFSFTVVPKAKPVPKLVVPPKAKAKVVKPKPAKPFPKKGY